MSHPYRSFFFFGACLLISSCGGFGGASGGSIPFTQTGAVLGDTVPAPTLTPTPAASSGCVGISQGIAPTTICGVSPSAAPDGSPAKMCKRGIAFDLPSLADVALLSKTVRWWYNWSAQPQAAVAGGFASVGMEFVPMVWSGTDIGKPIAASSALLGFNEPDNGGQANMTAQNAASLWSQVVSMASGQNVSSVVSPADAGDTTWLDQFVSSCSGCRMDAVAVHIYADTLGAVQSKVQAFKKYNKPLWITELACIHSFSPLNGCSVAEQQTFMTAVVPYLEGESQVARYSWFSNTNVPNSPLLQGDQLTALGQEYVNFAGTCTP